jgi:polyisoprenoid-binding protein YceI
MILQQRKRLLGLVIGGIAAVMVVVAAYASWDHFYGDDAPAPVSIEEAAGAVSSPPSTTAGAATDIGTPGADQTTGIEGEWMIANSADSFVGYRIGQKLVGVGANEVVGRTPAVEASAIIEGSSVTTASVTADLTQLQSGESLRDGTLRGQALETSDFPTATFELTEPLDLPAPLTEGQSVSVAARGDLTLHGTTQPIEIPLDAQLRDDTLVVVGSLDVTLADYGIEPPSAPVVASVDDHGVLELQLFLSRTG